MNKKFSTFLISLLLCALVGSPLLAKVGIRQTNVPVIDSGKALYSKDYTGGPVRLIEVDSSGAIEIDNGAVGTSISGTLTVDGAFGTTSDLTLSNDANIVQNGLTVVRDVIELADDAGVTLNAAATGVLTVWVEGDNELAIIHVSDDGSVVTASVELGSVALTDSDTDLCIYDVGTAPRIKNRLGATKNIVYKYEYK